MPEFARPLLLKIVPALSVALALGLIVSATAFAGATQTVVYCGDPLDLPTCDGASNYDWNSQNAILAERSLTETGQYVWTGQLRYGAGFIAGNDPIGGSANSGDPEIRPVYTDPAGEIGSNIYGLSYDAASQTIFVADTNNDRIVAYNRGSFDAAGDSPGAYPVDYSRGFAIGSTSGPRGISFDSLSNQLVVADTDNWRLNRYDFTPGARVGTPPAGGPLLNYESSFGSNEWSDEGAKPIDVAVDPSNGHTYVPVNSPIDPDRVYEYDQNDNFVQSFSTEIAGADGEASAVTIDADARLLYVVRAAAIEVFSMSTGNLLGTLDIGFDASGLTTLVDVDLDPITRTLYVVTSELAAADATEAPVAAYQLDPPPSCNLQNVTMLPGASQAITPSCTDVDTGTIEYSVVGPPSAGAAATLPDRSALSYIAPAQPGSATIPFRARSLNGRTVTFNQPVTIAAPPEDLTPVVRKTANLEPVSGVVQIKLPGSDKWIPLSEATLIPIGTVIDARKGKAHMTFANADGTLQDGIFWEGIFQVLQGSGDKPVVTLKLRDDLAGKATAAIASAIATPAGFKAWTARKKGKKKNGLWGDAKGKYKTSGKGGSATVRGTRWYVANYVNGSLFKVARGSVTIDPIRGKNFVLKAGKQFFIFYKKNP
ncbi:MAG: hypothetical protein ACRDKE_10570 [Solirubrobacterales bacterium]